jgi:hypothetical protein
VPPALVAGLAAFAPAPCPLAAGRPGPRLAGPVTAGPVTAGRGGRLTWGRGRLLLRRPARAAWCRWRRALAGGAGGRRRALGCAGRCGARRPLAGAARHRPGLLPVPAPGPAGGRLTAFRAGPPWPRRGGASPAAARGWRAWRRRRPATRDGPLGHLGAGVLVVLRRRPRHIPDPHRGVQRDLHPRHQCLHRPVSHHRGRLSPSRSARKSRAGDALRAPHRLLDPVET